LVFYCMKQIHTIEELPINLLTSIEYIKKSKQKGRFGIDRACIIFWQKTCYNIFCGLHVLNAWYNWVTSNYLGVPFVIKTYRLAREEGPGTTKQNEFGFAAVGNRCIEAITTKIVFGLRLDGTNFNINLFIFLKTEISNLKFRLSDFNLTTIDFVTP
jgi:hypothetical protein